MSNSKLSTERFVRLLLNHPKGKEAIEYFMSRSIPIYKCLEGIDGLDSTFPLKVIMKAQEYLYKKHLGKIGNNDRITGLTQKIKQTRFIPYSPTLPRGIILLDDKDRICIILIYIIFEKCLFNT